MSLIPTLSNPFLGAFAGGLLYGLAVCTAACLPYIASYIAGIGVGFRKGVVVTLFFNSGRIAAYALIGCLVAVFSGLFRLAVSDAAISNRFKFTSSLAFSIVSVIIGASILLKLRSPCECPVPGNKTAVPQGQRSKFGFNFGAFSLGLSRGLILCPPLIALLVYSLPFSTPIGSVGLAVLFGFGTALSPMLFLGGATGWLLNKAPLLRKWISIGGAGMLILLGIVALANSFIVLK